MQKKPLLVVVVGPTAVGKTDLSIAIAQHFDTEILSCDSRQFYSEMEIGTAKPNQNELAAVKHHFINTLSIKEDYDAGTFATDVEKLLPKLFSQHEVVVMVGGSGLYVRAVCEGLDQMPDVDPKLRVMLNEKLEKEGLSALLKELQKTDPSYFDFVDKNNTQRVIRALEVIRATGLPYSHFRTMESKKEHGFEILKVGLEMDRKKLYERIDLRMDHMIAAGLFEEAERLLPWKNCNALQTVGYKEVFDFMSGEYDKKEAIRLLKRNSRRYAKRQMTWFKKDKDVHWFLPNQKDDIIDYIETFRQ